MVANTIESTQLIVVWDKAKKSAKVIEVTILNDYGLNRAELES